MYEVFEKLLKQHNITAYRFCKDTGISTSTISTWKKKKSTISMDLAKKIADYFDISIEYLVDQNNNLKNSNSDDLLSNCKILKNILTNSKTSPIYIDGEKKYIDSDSIDLLVKQLDIFIALIYKLSN